MKLLKKLLYSCLTITIISITSVIIVVIVGGKSIFFQDILWSDMSPPSEVYNVSENNVITISLNMDDSAYQNFMTRLSGPERVSYIRRWVSVPNSISSKTGISSLVESKTYRYGQKDSIVFIFDEKYGSSEITVKVKGIRGEDYSSQQRKVGL